MSEEVKRRGNVRRRNDTRKRIMCVGGHECGSEDRERKGNVRRRKGDEEDYVIV